MSARYDCIITGGLVFDGTGAPPVREDVAISAGRVAARGTDLDRSRADQVIEAQDLWVIPGLVDLHTHLDLEVEFDPALKEAVRHGTTTVMMSNCSLGLAYGNQRRNGEDPLVDCFARVENMPKPVLRKVADKAVWTSSAGYYAHLDDLPLGCNVIPLIPHSMLRIEVMGLNGAVSRKAGEDDLRQMEALLETAMEEGYPGFSTDALPFHFLSEDPNRRVKIPSQFGQYRELKRLTSVLRRHDRIWQATPPKDSPLAVARNFALTSARLHGKPLKVTAVAALDVAANKSLRRLALLLTKLYNSPLFKGHFRFQALAAPFKVFWDGPINPLAEEIPALRELNELDLEDAAGRRALLDDPAFQARFSRMWMTGKTGFGPARLKRLLNMETLAFDRDFNEMVFHSGGPDIWTGETFAQVHGRYQAWRADASLARSDDERAAFEAMPDSAVEEAGFMLHLLREYDLALRWWTVSANRDPAIVRALLNHPQILPGFNDSGAHITNMAFYDGNLRCLQIAQSEGLERVASQIRRLTREPAEFIGVDAGRLEEGARADIAIIDPRALQAYDSEASSRFVWREDYEHEQMVNRSDGVVRAVLVSGVQVWDGAGFTEAAGRQTLGRALRHKSWAPQGEALKVAAE
ncbi:amidohydrolase family protein [Alkalicaulis satelles]|uniref:Amidohydrolase family protein n=1 Tax=Alkalicaulis satelles TaxID=2609175 RepID=A0A5M6ZFD6_9PROT|nr:amidohydrolase family protein [Alkalicaulis satelles]KAA5800951.1 amidohydrolase family protein [Alkalicaulis satelles]